MKKRIGIILVAILTVVVAAAALTACDIHGSPESVVKAFIKAGNDKDAGKMADCFYFEDNDDKKAAEEYFKSMVDDESYEKAETKDFKVEAKDDTAIVTYKIRTKGSDEEWTDASTDCIKKNGKWYIDFDAMTGRLDDLDI